MDKNFKIGVLPAPAREEIIANQLKTPIRQWREHEVYPNKEVDLPTIMLANNVPIYRMANGRTRTEQLSFIKREEKTDNFFNQGEENEEAQQVQHEILTQFAEAGTDSISPIIKVLRNGRQSDPILITAKGVVVNGNRRLAAMRELYEEDSKKFAHYGTVECAVLPDLTPDQIVELEIRLQMAPETKLPYGWINECLIIQDQVDQKKGEDVVAGLMRKKGSDVRNALAALQEANIYLKDWKQATGDYGRVENGKQFFYDLPKRLKGKSGVILESARRIAWMLFDNSDELGTRVYAFNTLIGEKVHDVLKSLAANSDVLVEDETTEASNEDTGDTLAVDFGPTDTNVDVNSKVLIALNDAGRREEVSAAVIAVCQTMYEANRTTAQGQTALRTLSDIQTRLQEIDLTNAFPETFSGMAKQIQEILRLAHELDTKIKKGAEAIQPKAEKK